MTAKPFSIHDQIVENAKRLNQRSQAAISNMERLKQDRKGAWKSDQTGQ